MQNNTNNTEKLGENALKVTLIGICLMVLLFISSAFLVSSGTYQRSPSFVITGLVGLGGWFTCLVGGVMGLCSLDSTKGKISSMLGMAVFLLFGLAMCATTR